MLRKQIAIPVEPQDIIGREELPTAEAALFGADFTELMAPSVNGPFLSF
jgi:hypothetical protein